MAMSLLVSIPLEQIGSRDAFELQLDLHEAAEGVTIVQQRSTAAAFLGYFDEKARSDRELSEERTQHMCYRQEESDGGTEGSQEEKEQKETVKYAEIMGRRIRDIGDEYMDQIYRDPTMGSYVESMVTPSEEKSAAQNTFEHFCEVSNILLECNDYGAALKITVGRIAALFSYCYHLCKVYMERNGVKGVVGFLGTLLGYLIRCLYRSKFYEWLSSVGGWSQLVKQTYQILPTSISSLPASAPVIIGATLLIGFMAYRYFYNR